jgi:hypothetical protein
MRDFCLQFGIDRQLEDAARAKQQLDAERWRDELRPRAMRLFAARTAKLAWSRGLLKLVVSELSPDDLFTELVGNLDRVPRRQWPHVVAIVVALRQSWQRGWTHAHHQAARRLAHNATAQASAITQVPTITTLILRLASVLSRLSASLQPLTGLTA